ncbi:hypothetical protein F4778DRAFT_786127 [Xylariomycetidae sp. FL2044]|nr:hypothetical protein F4778DRAFT_786127 [Xylariomycetidae sp. FL2044]
MDITNFVVSTRNQALLYGDYNTYHQLSAKKLHNCRKKLHIATKSRGKFSKKGPVTAAQISESHDYLHLLLLTAERAWAQAMRYKAVHSTDTKTITGRTRSHIISRLDKAARTAENLVQILSDKSASGAADTDILEARAYASMIRGATQFEKQNWEPCLRSFSTARIIYSALSSTIKGDILKDLLSETIDPSIRYAAYQSKVPRTLAIPTIARKAFPSSDTSLVEKINALAPKLLKQSDSEARKGQVDAPNAPQTITWRSREVEIEDASIALALAAVDLATNQLAEKLASSDVVLPREMAAAYDPVLIASQDAADATKHAIDELKEEGVPQSDPRIQRLQITRTAVNYQMISWRIGRNRVLSGEHDGALLDSAPNTTRKSKKDATARKPKAVSTGKKISRLREKVVLYDSTLQSLDSVRELPGVAADEGLVKQLDAATKYFHSLKCLSIARSHLLTSQSLNALALIKHAFDECQQSTAFFSKHGSPSAESSPHNIDIRQSDIQYLNKLLKGELERSRAIVEIDNLRNKTKPTATQVKIPIIQRLSEYPPDGVDLEHIVDYPPKVEPIPVKPLFFDVAWNYIDYPGTAAPTPEAAQKAAQPAAPQKKVPSMPGHRASSSLSELMMFDPDSDPRPRDPAWSVNKMWKSTSSLPAFASEEQTRRRRTVPLPVFLSSIVCFCILTLALGLGLGLGWPRSTTIYSAPPFNYSSYYGIPDSLDFVPIDKLINSKELELDTGFVVLADAPQVREFTFNISQASAAPDGFQKPMILVNGQSPGPLIEANIGDTVRVHVNNFMGNWSTTIHWHGIDQKNTTWMDGVAGVSQCGIPPGRNFTYEFQVAGQRGTYWYHAHLSVQYSDGLYGPLIIHDPEELVPETDEEKIVFVGDLYHTYGSVLLTSYLNPTSEWVPFESGVEPLADNILINGQNTYNCSVNSTTYPPDLTRTTTSAPNCTGDAGRLWSTKVQSNQRIRLRLINASSFLSYWFSIDNHTLTIVELDGTEIEPLAARGVYLNIGQRVSVVVETNQTRGNYYMRATLPQTCFLPYAPYTSAGLEAAGYGARAILSYDDVDLAEAPLGLAGNTSNPFGVDNNGVRGDVWEGCDDMPFDMPVPMRQAAAYEVGEGNRHYIEYVFRQAQDVNRIFINKTAYAPLPDNATLWKAIEQQFDPSEANSYNSWDFGLNQQVLLVPDGGKGAQIVINSRDAMEHPWHLQLTRLRRFSGWGKGYFGQVGESDDGNKNGTTETTTTTWNLENPMRRDTVTVPAFSHVVIRFEADNPGLWALHCHVAWHMEGGMFVSLAERPSDLVKLVAGMDPETRRLSQSFCDVGGGQGFGSGADYEGVA